MQEAHLALQLLIMRWDEPRLRDILAAIDAAGLDGPRETVRANMPEILKIIHPILIDCSDPASIKDDQTQPITINPATAQPDETPAAVSDNTAATDEGTANNANREITNHNQTPGAA